MGREWPALIANVSSYSETIPPEGVALSTFKADCLGLVDFESRDAIVRALRGKRIIFPARLGLEWRVFGRPLGQRFADPIDSRVKAFVQVVGPHVERIGRLIDTDQGDPARREARALHQEAAAQVTTLIRRHIERGATLSIVRDALWRTFRPDALAILARYEGALSRDSTITTPAPLPVKRRNVPPGLPPIERVIALADKAGCRGITKGDLREHFPKPRPSAADLDAWLAQACEADVLRGEAMKLGVSGRPGMRYFHYNHESPRTVDGVAVFD